MVNTTPACTTCYLSYDHLGSVRMVTDQNGNVVSRQLELVRTNADLSLEK